MSALNAIAVDVARRVFAKRGNKAEAHIEESELVAILTVAIERSGQPDLLAACERMSKLYGADARSTARLQSARGHGPAPRRPREGEGHVSLSPDQLSVTIDRLRRMRHAKAMSAPKPDPDGSLVPLLEVSAECCALDVAIKGLEQLLQEAAS